MSNEIMKDIKIKYEGQTHQIDATTFINSLLHISTLIQEISKELHPDKKVEIKINALQPGSFIVDIFLQASWLSAVGDLFTHGNLTIASEISGVLGGLISLRQLLKKEKPATILIDNSSTTITNNNGDTTIINNNVYNIYSSNHAIQEALSNEFEVLNNDINIEGFVISDNQNNVITNVPREQFYGLSESPDQQEKEENKTILKIVMLNIIRLSFEKNMKWEFYLDGHKIAAKMDDLNFYKMIDNGEKFAKGDSLEAEIELKQQFDKSVNTFINKTYRVTRIIKHIPRSSQGHIDFSTM